MRQVFTELISELSRVFTAITDMELHRLLAESITRSRANVFSRRLIVVLDCLIDGVFKVVNVTNVGNFTIFHTFFK